MQFSYLAENTEQPVNAVKILIHVDAPSAPPCIAIVVVEKR
jgi:hypothetical protein